LSVLALDHTNAKTADGAAVVRWIEDRTETDHLCAASRKRVERWRKGGQASFWAVDELLNELGFHPSELPEAVWVHYRNGNGRGCG
jgi:hypothetical protein